MNKRQIKQLALWFVLMLVLWFAADYIPQMLTAADTLINLLGVITAFVTILICSFIILKIKQNKNQKPI